MIYDGKLIAGNIAVLNPVNKLLEKAVNKRWIPSIIPFALKGES